MGGWALVIAAGLLAGSVLDARAQKNDSPCGSDDIAIPTGRVARIVDGRSFVLHDGREVRLAALDVPLDLNISGNGPGARAALEACSAG